MGKLFYVMGKSSTGKDTIYKKIIDVLYNENNLLIETMILYTTRPPREGEVEGVNYHFVNEKTFQQLNEDGQVIESRTYKRVNDTVKYFTVYDKNIDFQNKNYIGLGTLESYNKVKKYYGEDIVIPIYIEVENEQRILRAIKRESEQNQNKKDFTEVCRRYVADEADFSKDNLKKANITTSFINDDIIRCTDEVIKSILLNIEC